MCMFGWPLHSGRERGLQSWRDKDETSLIVVGHQVRQPVEGRVLKANCAIDLPEDSHSPRPQERQARPRLLHQ